jgi:NADH-quinone oxidoreductase subunit L
MVWAILLPPLLGAVLNGLIIRPSSKIIAHSLAVACMLVSFVSAILLFSQLLQGSDKLIYYGYDWLSAYSLKIPFELAVDKLSIIMVLIITGIGTIIHIYSGGYMAEEKSTYRFFSYLNLFVFMMLTLVLANNFVVMFVGWEGVGLCSYLLIGYWFESKENASAGMKAFVVNRIGDIGFLLAMFVTYKYFGTLSFSELKEITLQTNITTDIATIITLLMFIGACGKSAQVPLYIWLPDAMAGPTPVSALIHAATMVTAGIYMMARLHFFYYLAPISMDIVAITGCVTALFAASIALTQMDIKKVLAYSTVSQLGYMVMACGVGAFDAGVFHLLTHACFKALLFLGAGSVIVAMHHQQDMRHMGGLKKYMPITHLVFLIGVLAIIGVPGLSGFFSKDEILWKAFIYPKFGKLLWLSATITAGLTSFYMVRLLCLSFYGENRSDEKTKSHLHETPALMWAPLCVLAFLSIVIGYLGIPPVFGVSNLFADFLATTITVPQIAKEHWSFLSAHHSHSLEWSLMAASTSVVLFSALFAQRLYSNGLSKQADSLKKTFPKLYHTTNNKYWVDEIYNNLFVQPLKEVSQFILKIIDIKIIGEGINKLAQTAMTSSAILSFKVNGSFQTYSFIMIVGVIIFSLFFT